MSTSLDGHGHDVLDVAAVMARYGLRDRRSARRVMDIAGAFMVAGRLVVRRDDLARFEEEQIRARSRAGQAETSRGSAPVPAPSRRRPGDDEVLRPGWWRAA